MLCSYSGPPALPERSEGMSVDFIHQAMAKSAAKPIHVGRPHSALVGTASAFVVEIDGNYLLIDGAAGERAFIDILL